MEPIPRKEEWKGKRRKEKDALENIKAPIKRKGQIMDLKFKGQKVAKRRFSNDSGVI